MATEKEKKQLASPPNNTPYILAVVVMVIAAIAGIAVILVLRPDSDPLVVSGVIAGIFTPTALSLMSFLKAQETHVLVNSRMSEAITDAAKAAYGEGMKAGRESANERTDMLAGKKK
jgi:Mn2+/Fe2+ NRAMP family transporter